MILVCVCVRGRDVGYDEKRVNLVRRIDFAWAVEREDPSKKRKSEGASAKDGATSSQQQWQWQSLVENLQLAHQELSVIIDLINTVKNFNPFLFIAQFCVLVLVSYTKAQLKLFFHRCSKGLVLYSEHLCIYVLIILNLTVGIHMPRLMSC